MSKTTTLPGVARTSLYIPWVTNNGAERSVIDRWRWFGTEKVRRHTPKTSSLFFPKSPRRERAPGTHPFCQSEFYRRTHSSGVGPTGALYGLHRLATRHVLVSRAETTVCGRVHGPAPPRPVSGLSGTGPLLRPEPGATTGPRAGREGPRRGPRRTGCGRATTTATVSSS